MQDQLTDQDLCDYAKTRAQADCAASQAEQEPCTWMQNIGAAMAELQPCL